MSSDQTTAPKKNEKSPLRRFAFALLAAVLALGVVGATATAASAAPAPDAPGVTEASAVAYEIGAGGQAIIDEFGIEWIYQIEGGYLAADGTGVIDLSGGQEIVITNSAVMGDVLMIQASYTGYLGSTLSYSGLLDAVQPGMNLYEGELEDLVFGNEILFDFPGLILTPVR